MIRAYVKVNDLDDIIELNKASASCNYKLSIDTGIKILNPKSLITLFELGVGKIFPLIAKIDNYEGKVDFLNKFDKFIVRYENY